MTPEKRQSGVTLPTELWRYVEAVKATGLYGDKTSSVVRSLIADAIKDCVAKGIIAVPKETPMADPERARRARSETTEGGS